MQRKAQNGIYGTPKPESMDSFRRFHFKRIVFQLFLKSSPTLADDMEKYIGSIASSMPVKQYMFNEEHLCWLESFAYNLYVDLKAPENDYTTQKVECDEVELVCLPDLCWPLHSWSSMYFVVCKNH